MNKITTIFYLLTVSLFLIMTTACGNSGSGRKQGEIYGECFKDQTCNEGLVCDTENNVCIRDNTADGDAESPDDTEAPDADSDSNDSDDSDPSKDEYGNWKDPKTGLIWSEKHSVAELSTHEDAVAYCDDLSEGGFSDWKLPTIDELRTLIQNCPYTEPYGYCKISEEAGALSWYDDLDKIWGCNCYWEDEWTQQTGKGEFVNDNGGHYSKLGDKQDTVLYSSSKSDYGGNLWCISFDLADILICTLTSINAVRNPEIGVSIRCVGTYSRQKQCEGLPENAGWNIFSSIPQRWDGSLWQPNDAASYNEKPSETECRFICNPGYKWDGSKCVLQDLKAISKCSRESPTPCYDSSSGLVWSAKASYEMLYKDAVDYCDNLVEGGFDGWHLPTISELRTLIQNCPDTMTGGECGVTDDCLSSKEECYVRGICEPYICSDGYGGDDDRFSKLGDKDNFISYSKVEDYNWEDAWGVSFNDAHIIYCSADEEFYDYTYSVRCVKKVK